MDNVKLAATAIAGTVTYYTEWLIYELKSACPFTGKGRLG